MLQQQQILAAKRIRNGEEAFVTCQDVAMAKPGPRNDQRTTPHWLLPGTVHESLMAATSQSDMTLHDSSGQVVTSGTHEVGPPRPFPSAAVVLSARDLSTHCPGSSVQ